MPPGTRPGGADAEDPKGWGALGTISEKEETETEGTAKLSVRQSPGRGVSKKKKAAIKPPLHRKKKPS